MPILHQPAADVRMVDLQALLFVLGERGMIALQLFSLAVQIGQGLVERQHADILQKRSQKDFLGQ